MKVKTFYILVILILFASISSELSAQVDSTLYLNYSKKFEYIIRDIKHFKINFDECIDILMAEHLHHYVDVCFQVLSNAYSIYYYNRFMYDEHSRYSYACLILYRISIDKEIIDLSIYQTNKQLNNLNNQILINIALDFKKYAREILEQLEKWEKSIKIRYKIPETPKTDLGY